jgi:hypothetical protein
MRKPATKTAAIMAPMSHQLTLANGVGAGGAGVDDGDGVGVGGAVGGAVGVGFSVGDGVGAGVDDGDGVGVGDAVGVGFSVGDGVGVGVDVGIGGGGVPPLVLYVTDPKLWDEGRRMVIFIHPIMGGRLTSALISSPTTL